MIFGFVTYIILTRNLTHYSIKSTPSTFLQRIILAILFYKGFYISTCINSSTDFSPNLRTKSKQCLPYQLASKKIRTQTKFKNKQSNCNKYLSDIAESILYDDFTLQTY